MNLCKRRRAHPCRGCRRGVQRPHYSPTTAGRTPARDGRDTGWGIFENDRPRSPFAASSNSVFQPFTLAFFNPMAISICLPAAAVRGNRDNIREFASYPTKSPSRRLKFALFADHRRETENCRLDPQESPSRRRGPPAMRARITSEEWYCSKLPHAKC